MTNRIHPSLHSLHALHDIEGNAIDAHFSWSPCECCGNTLGGDRYECEALAVEEGSLVQLDNCNACPDCVVKFQ
jgi:hypothetical protein